MSDSKAREVATLAGGCFWCLEAVYVRHEGVHRVTSGYMGGHVANPTYREVCGGDTGHAEVVQIEYDPAIVSYRDLLEVFFAIHDPTTRDRQGNDVGSQYRSAVFCHTAAQAEAAQSIIEELSRERVFPASIVTEVVTASVFTPAEDYHRDYYDRNPGQPYCQSVVAPKVAKFRKKFAGRLKA
ncbi:MAG: peptide-methionine (S)-S-oxide reductase MsrA [Burkholderiales bacterium]